MTIRLEENDHVLYFWHATAINDDEFLMMLYERDGRWTIDCRFRYIKDNEKSFYHVECKRDTSEETATELCRFVFEQTNETYCMNRVCQRIDGDLHKFIEVMKKYDYFLVRKAKGE